jgi:hypothetical protein
MKFLFLATLSLLASNTFAASRVASMSVPRVMGSSSGVTLTTFDHCRWRPFLRKTNAELFNLKQAGNCVLINNNGNYGVLVNGVQVSVTTHDASSAGASLRLAIMQNKCVNSNWISNWSAELTLNNANLFTLGRAGIGECSIIENAGYYGVVRSGRVQVSATTANSSTVGGYLRTAITSGSCGTSPNLGGSIEQSTIIKTNTQLFQMNSFQGCTIINNNGYYGVLANGVQVTATTTNSSAAGATLRTAIMQRKCAPVNWIQNWNSIVNTNNTSVFSAGRNGVGECVIIENAGYFGVVASGYQASATTNSAATVGGYLRTLIVNGECGPTPNNCTNIEVPAITIPSAK